MKELENNLLGEIAYQMNFISFLEGVKVSNPDITDKEFETFFQKWESEILFAPFEALFGGELDK